MAKASEKPTDVSVEDRRKQLQDQSASLDKVGSIVTTLKGFSPEAAREALHQAAISLKCIKPRKARTAKPKAIPAATEGAATPPAEVPAAV